MNDQKKTPGRLDDERQALMAEQLPSLRSLVQAVRRERPLAVDEFVLAVATLCQCAYEDRSDYVLNGKQYRMPPINPADYKGRMIVLASNYLSWEGS